MSIDLKQFDAAQLQKRDFDINHDSDYGWQWMIDFKVQPKCDELAALCKPHVAMTHTLVNELQNKNIKFNILEFSMAPWRKGFDYELKIVDRDENVYELFDEDNGEFDFVKYFLIKPIP